MFQTGRYKQCHLRVNEVELNLMKRILKDSKEDKVYISISTFNEEEFWIMSFDNVRPYMKGLKL